MHGVPPLVQKGAHVVIQSHRVHENEGEPGFVKGGVVAAGGLALAGFQVQQAEGPHGLEVIPELGVHLPQDLLASPGEGFRISRRALRGSLPSGSTERSQGFKRSRPIYFARLRCIFFTRGRMAFSALSWKASQSAGA